VFGGKEYLNDPGVTGGTHTYLFVRYFLLAPRFPVKISQVTNLGSFNVG
jgi:hypothetical protein